MTDQSVSLERLVFYDWQKNSLLDSDDDFHWGYQLPLHVPTTVLTAGLFKIDNCAWLCYKLNVLSIAWSIELVMRLKTLTEQD